MPPDWLKIKKARPDLTDYLIHWTRGEVVEGKRISAFENLMSIIQSGVLYPTFAPKRSMTVGGVSNTIQGPHPAVCFTEQPLDAFVRSYKALGRYRPYGIALRKDRLFVYGGRPAIYADKALLSLLPEEHKYLWVRFNPIRSTELGGYPVDWTHEREWRAKVKPYNYKGFEMSPPDGVPLLLPIDFEPNPPMVYLPWIIVRTAEEAAEIKDWISELPVYKGANKVLGLYFAKLPNVLIVALDDVEEHLEAGDHRWARLDTLPYDELDPAIAKSFKQIGWGIL